MEYKLLYDTPAKSFSEALPIGNGKMGAMAYGEPLKLHFSLNADTLWSGKACAQDHVIVPEKYREEVRKLLKNGKYWEAQNLVQNKMLSEKYNESYISARFLDCFLKNTEETKSYTRELNMNTACVSTNAVSNSDNIQTESFISCSENVLVIRISSKKKQDLNICLNSLLNYSINCDGRTVLLQGEAPEHVEPNYVDCENAVVYGNGMKFIILTKVHSTDGTVSQTDKGLTIENASESVLITAIETEFTGWNKPFLNNWKELTDRCQKRLNCAGKYDFEGLKKRHERIHKSYFERVKIHIASGEESDTGLYEHLFQYGRYLMICSSRPADEMIQPANLQGIWCEDIRSVWSSNWTVNINIEMNYWLNGPCALSECEIPLINMIAEAAEAGKNTAKETFGGEGWAACHNLDLWRQTTPVKGEVKWSYWPMGGVWLTTHLYRHYLYTNDKIYLKNQAWPIMRETAKFCLSRLREENGVLYTDFSTSPENTFLDKDNRECALSESVTMDIALIREVFMECIDTCRILGIDQELERLLENRVQKLPEYQVGELGQLLEWNKEFAEKDEHHRHFAHLVGFHPFHQIDFDTRRELLESVERVLERRIHGVTQYIGWGEAWLCNFYARLRNGCEAEKHLKLFLKHCCYGNLLGLHPPLGESCGEKEIFQIDGNFGITAGIGEMLLQSKRGIIDVFPALPDSWKEGELSGVYAVGGHKLNLHWKDGALEKMCLYGGCEESVTIRYRSEFEYREKNGHVRKSEACEDGWRLNIEVKEQEEYCFYGKQNRGI